MKYKVNYSGFAYVEADDEEEAAAVFTESGDFEYSEQTIDSVEEVDDFIVEI